MFWSTTIPVFIVLLLSTFCNSSTFVPAPAHTLQTVRDYGVEAQRVMVLSRKLPDIWWYLGAGSFEDETMAENELAFNHIRLRPRIFRDVHVRDLSVTLLGDKVAMPIGIAPSAQHKHWDPDGELATVYAAKKMGAIMILSLASTYTIEEVAKAEPEAILWFQMFLPNIDPTKRDVSKDLIKRAEASGYRAIVLTVDSPVSGLRYTMARHRFSFFATHKLANFVSNEEYRQSQENRLTWSDLSWIKEMTKLPIVIKGILTADDAREAVKAGVAGIIVSNHGGRELDSVPASIEVLPEIVEAVNGKIDVYLDGGIRSGKDVFKALAIGAKAVFVGRPVPFGLIVGGKEGGARILQILRNELDSVMGLSGCATLGTITKDYVSQRNSYRNRNL